MINPYEVIKQSQAIPPSIQEEMNDVNTSLDKRNSRDGRAPLLDAYMDNRLRSNKPITFLSFIDDFSKLWEASGKPGKIVRQSPIKEKAEYPTITYRILKREINETFKDIKPRLRATIRHPYMNNEYIELYGQIFDLTVEFCVYSKSSEEADELVMEVEEFLQTYAGFFKKQGVQEILFNSQGEDEIEADGRVSVAKRKLTYIIRFEKIITRFLNEIEQIAIQANLLQQGEEN